MVGSFYVQHRRKAFRTPAPAIAPEILWLEADFGVTQSGGSVSAWADRSANGYSFTQSTAGNRPTLVAAALNGNPVLRFDGGDWLSMSTTLLNTSGASATVYIVADHRGGTTGSLLSTRSVTPGNGWTLRYSSATGLQYFHPGFTPVVTRTLTDKYNLIELQRSGLSIALGDSGALPSASTMSGFTADAIGTWVGVEQQGTSSALNGDIAAIVIATTNRSGILSYLQTKYGV